MTEAATRTLDKVQPAPTPALTKAPEIDPATVVLQIDGLAYRTIFARLPLGATADDLKSPGLWAQVQARGKKALRRLDEVRIVDYRESWVATAVVAHADGAGAQLAGVKIVTFPERYQSLPSDDKFEVVWTGLGYQVRRRVDGFLVTQPVPNVTLAERDLRAQYPQRGAMTTRFR